MVAWPVSKRVNTPRNNDATLIDPYQSAEDRGASSPQPLLNTIPDNRASKIIELFEFSTPQSLVGLNFFFDLQVKGFEWIDDAFDLNVPKTCFFEPRTMLADPL
jgi:hypothetical protein